MAEVRTNRWTPEQVAALRGRRPGQGPADLAGRISELGPPRTPIAVRDKGYRLGLLFAPGPPPSRHGKVCVGCGRDLPLGAFHRQRIGRLGRHPRCRACRRGERARGSRVLEG